MKRIDLNEIRQQTPGKDVSQAAAIRAVIRRFEEQPFTSTDVYAAIVVLDEPETARLRKMDEWRYKINDTLRHMLKRGEIKIFEVSKRNRLYQNEGY
jgi:hypothetical protein